MKNTDNNQNKKSLASSQEKNSIDSSFRELVIEANSLFNVLDNLSTQIRELEKNLTSLKANFPFSLIIIKEKESLPMPPEDRHKGTSYNVLSYFTQNQWSLCWDLDENSKNYRLFLVLKEAEVICCEGYGDACFRRTFLKKIISKKPLIEYDLETRLSCSHHLVLFINKFREYLKSYRTSIEAGGGRLLSE